MLCRYFAAREVSAPLGLSDLSPKNTKRIKSRDNGSAAVAITQSAQRHSCACRECADTKPGFFIVWIVVFLVDPDLYTSVTDQVDRLVMPRVKKVVERVVPTLPPPSPNMTSAAVCSAAANEIRDAILTIAKAGHMVHITIQEQQNASVAFCRIIDIPVASEDESEDES